MKFVVNRAEMKSKLTQVAPAVAKSSTLPVLEHVLLQASGETLTLRASNLETGIQVSLPAAVEEEGACMVPFKSFLDWIGAPLPKDQVTITLTSTLKGKEGHKSPVSLRVQCGRNYCTLKGLLPEEEAPVFPVVDGVTDTIHAGEFVTAVDAVEWATMPEAHATKIVCTGIRLEIQEDRFRLVAMDGFNLAVYDLPVHSPFAQTELVVVNKPSMLAASVLSGEIEVGVGENHVVFKTDDVTLAAATVVGEFPDYEAMLARAGGDNVWVMEKEEAVRLVKIVAPFAVHQYGGPIFVRVELSADTKLLSVDGISPDVGDCVGSIEAEGERDIRFAIAPKYMKQALASIAAAKLMFVLADPKSPLLLKAVESDRHKIVMMPVRVKEVSIRDQEVSDVSG